MSENTTKGVTVTTLLNATTNREFHPEAAIIQVRDGHLFVEEAGTRNTVAIYAPGKWLKAVVSE